MQFSPAYLSSLIVKPLRYLYARYTEPDLAWNEDPKISNIEIDTINNFNKIAIQSKPRILVSRGEYTIKPTGLTDNLSQGTTSRASGPNVEQRFLLVYGMSQVLIEARNEGTCERIVEITEDFLTRSGPAIAGAHGFKQFATPLSVSSCTPGREDTEIFQCTINLPWSKEIRFQVIEDGIEFKDFLLSIAPEIG